MTGLPRVERARPGGLPADLWAVGPERLAFRGAAVDPSAQPALYAREPEAVAWLGLEAEDLVLLGPYGDIAAFGAVVGAAAAAARDTGRARLVASVRNDEIERFEWLQRLGFVLVEARVGALAGGDGAKRDEGESWGDIAMRDELVLAAAVATPHA